MATTEERIEFIDQCIALIPQLPMTKCVYSAPCIIGIFLPLEERMFFGDTTVDNIPSHAQYQQAPRFKHLLDTYGADFLREIQDLHDNLTEFNHDNTEREYELKIARFDLGLKLDLLKKKLEAECAK